MKNLLITIAITALTLFGCGGANQENSLPRSDASGADAPSLLVSEKSPAEVLQAKYRKALLRCELRTQKGIRLIERATPQDSFSWNLLNGATAPKTFKLQGDLEKSHSLTIWVTVTAVRIADSIRRMTNEGNWIELQNSPVLDLSFHYEDSSNSSGEGSSKVYENIMDRIFSLQYLSEESSASNPDIFPPSDLIDLRCLLSTELKSRHAKW